MHPLAILGGSSFLLALILTPVFRNLLTRWGFVEHKDQARKHHASPIPNMGGIPIAIAYVASFGILRLFGPNLRGTNLGHGILDYSLTPKLFAASAIVLLAGILDDWIELQPVQKILAQIVASILLFASGVRITGIVDFGLPFTVSFLVTVLWLLACTNAFNLIDGIDGLAAGVGLFATATTLIAALLQHNMALAAVTVPLVGALIGFLRYNFNPATIFLGDSGSCLVGFLLGCFSIIWSQKSATILGMTAPLMALSVPILDALLAIVRRFLRRQPILRSDRAQIHHRLLERGFSQRKVVLLLYVIAGIGAAFSLFQSFPSNRYSGAVILVFCAIAWIGVQHLGYDEFEQARQIIVNGGFRRALNSQLDLRAFRDSLETASSTEEAWGIIKEASRQFGFLDVCWQSGEQVFRSEISGSEEATWALRVPLAATDYVEFIRGPGKELLTVNINAFAEAVRQGLSRLASLASESRVTPLASQPNSSLQPPLPSPLSETSRLP